MRYPALYRMVRTAFVLSFVCIGASACGPAAGLVSIPLNLAINAAFDDEPETATPSTASPAPAGPISVEAMLARARGEEVPEVAPAPIASGIRLNFAEGPEVAREAALVWMLSASIAEGQPVYLIAAPDGEAHDPDAAFNGIRRANSLKAWLQAMGRKVIVRFDAAGAPGTVLLSRDSQAGGPARA